MKIKSAESNTELFLKWIIPIAVCFIGLHFTCFGICGYNLSRIPGDLGDVRFNMYVLEHGFQFISGQLNHYWDAPFMYPAHNVLALSDNLLGSMPVYALFRFLNYDRETSFQLWFIAVTVLNFATAFYVLKKLTRNFLLASAGAYLFAFSILLFCEYGHAQVFPRFITPLVIYWILIYFENFRFKYLGLAVAGVVYQFYCGMYLGFCLVIVSAVLFSVLLGIHFQKMKSMKLFAPRNVLLIMLIPVAGVVLLFPLALPYISMYKITQGMSFDLVLNYVPKPISYFFATKFSYTWSILSQHAMNNSWEWWDQQIFIGAVPWIVFAVALVLCFRKSFLSDNKKVVALALTLLACIIITTRFGNFSLFKFVFKIPGFSILRAVHRVMNVYLFLFAAVLCLLMNSVIIKKRTLWFSILLAAVIADNISSPDAGTLGAQKKEMQKRYASIVEQLNNVNWEGKYAFAYLSDGTEEVEIQLDGMMASQLVHMPCVNGYSSTSVPGFGEFWGHHNEEALNRWLDLNHINRSTVIIVR